ncbi:MAG: hypothetical protein AAGB93_09330 [Planctomycetota bacterium]
MLAVRRTLTAAPLAVLASLLASCGGGGGGGGGGPEQLVSAGPDRTVGASTLVLATASAAPGSGVDSFAWRQVQGPTVALDPGAGASSATVGLVTTDVDSVLVLEVAGLATTGDVIGVDRVSIVVDAVRPTIRGVELAALSIRGGGAGRARSACLHRASARLFVVDGVAGDVVVYDVSDPSSPSFAGAIAAPAPTFGYDPGPALDVGCGADGAVAVTWSGQTLEFPGRVQFIDPITLAELASLSSFGANPVDVAAADDGSLFAVACAADRLATGGADGRGYVTLFRVPPAGPGAIDVHADISPIPFGGFDGSETELAQAGVRWFSPNSPRASIELTPRAVALSPDGSVAWAACPENDALLVIDTATEVPTACVPLDDRAWGTFAAGAAASATRALWTDAPPILTTPAGDAIPFGGVAGIASALELVDGSLALTVVTGAGSSLAPLEATGDSTLDLPLVDPDRQLTVDRVVIDAETGDVEVSSTVPLASAAGAPVTGRANAGAIPAGLAGSDESIVDLDGNPVAPSLLGARFAGATIGANGDLWLADPRRCGLWRFDLNGRLVERFVPEGSPANLGTDSLPEVFGTRRANLSFDAGRRFGGFGGIAYDGDRGVVAAVPRLPLDNPDDADETVSRASAIVRLVEVVASTGVCVGEYVVVLDGPDHAFEGLARGTAGGPFDGAYVLLEASIEPSGARTLHALDPSGATNLRSLSAGDYAAVDAVLESTAPADLSTLPTPIVPARKAPVVDLTDAGLGGGGRPSGVVALGDDLVVTFDDDWGLAGASVDASTGRIVGRAPAGTSVARIALRPVGIDASSVGDGFAPRALPIVGLPQPVDLVAYDDRGEPRLALANGGHPRVLPSGGPPPFDERRRVGDLTLDTTVFPGAAALQQPEVAGDLRVSSLGSDENGDMLVELLQAFGSRSIAVHDGAGAPLWSSGERLVARAAEERADAVRAGATERGIQPRAVAVTSAVPGGAPVLVTALQGAGLVVAHDLASPRTPVFAGVVARPDAPTGVDVADIGGPLMVTVETDLGRVLLTRLVRD